MSLAAIAPQETRSAEVASYASRVRIDVTEREAVPVLYTASAGDPSHIPDLARAAWHELEARVPVSGRKAYGYWDPGAQEYRACYAVKEEDDRSVAGVARGVIPGGIYRRARLEGDDVYAKIGPAFDELARDASVDESRPWFEFYRREGEVDIFVPIEG
jgi:DNA gyrase inhibitor GyrI